jgi:TorA maturation chaperone TorD
LVYLEEYGEEGEIAELYRLFAGLFMKAPTTDDLLAMKEIFQMTFDDTWQEVKEDFSRLFGGPKAEIPPFESLYSYPLGYRPMLKGPAAKEVEAFYQNTGLVMQEDLDLEPDHISAELLFVSYLIDNSMDDLHKRFLEEHLVKWVPEYCDEIPKRAKTTFYREVAKLLKELILSDSEEP